MKNFRRIFLGAVISWALSGSLSFSDSFSARPSWLPTRPCKGAWLGLAKKGYDQFNRARDGDYATYLARLDRTRCSKKWTVLIYMAADNDLTPYAYWDLYEMEAGWSESELSQMDAEWEIFKEMEPGRAPQVRGATPALPRPPSQKVFSGSGLRTDVLVHLETARSPAARRIHVFERPETYNLNLRKADFARWKDSDLYSPIVETLNEVPVSGGDRFSIHNTRLREFIEWGVRNYPSDNIMLVVWGHGQGWTSYGVPQDQASPFSQRRFGGLAFDQSSGTYLGVKTLRGILSSVRSQVFQNKRGIDVYASDACLMQMAEVATEISDSARFIVGSEQVQDFLGLPYRNLLYILNTGRFRGTRDWNSIDPARKKGWLSPRFDEPYMLAQAIPKVVKRSFDPMTGLQGILSPRAIETMTMSSVSSSELREKLIPQMKILGNALSHYLRDDDHRAAIQKQIAQASVFQSGTQELGLFVHGLIQTLKAEYSRTGVKTPQMAELMEAAARTHQALDQTVLSFALGTQYETFRDRYNIAGFRGLSVWIPRSRLELHDRIDNFRTAELYRILKAPPTSVSIWEKWFWELYSEESSIYSLQTSGALLTSEPL